MSSRPPRGVTSHDERAVPDFSISHAGPWVACAALTGGRVGLDLEMGADARIADWVVREAALKASGHGLRALREVGELQLVAGVGLDRDDSVAEAPVARVELAVAGAERGVVAEGEVEAAVREADVVDHGAEFGGRDSFILTPPPTPNDVGFYPSPQRYFVMSLIIRAKP